MGRRIEEDTEKTVDLGRDLAFAVSLPDDCGLECAKLHGIGSRERQEDAFGVSEAGEELTDKGLLLVLADGMGGGVDGEKASVAAVIACLEFFDQNGDIEKNDIFLQDMAIEANERVKEALGRHAGMGGSTLVVVWTDTEKVFWATVGDSRLYLFRNGELIQLNHEHVYAAKLQEMVEQQEITEEEALHHPQRKALTSYLGMEELEEVDGTEDPLCLEEGDWLLLLSDGVFGTVSEEEITEALSYHPNRAARHLSMKVEQRRKPNQDNYTGILLKCL